MNTMRNFAIANLSHDVSVIDERAKNFLSDINEDITYLSDSPVFRNFLQTQSASITVGGNNQVKELMLHQFLAFIKTKPMYYQIYFIDKNHDELFRVQFYNSSPTIIPEDQLSEGRFTFYFYLTDTLKQGEFAVIPSEHLALDGQKIAGISFAMRIYDGKGNFQGILITDILAKYLFKLLETPSILHFNRKIAIVSSEGHYLYHSQKKKDWNRLLATRDTETLFDEYRSEFTTQILSGKSGIISDIKDELLAYSPLFAAQFQGGNAYYLFESVEKKFIFGSVRRFILIFSPILFFFLLISISFGYLATSQLAGPVKMLQRGAEIITHGNYSYRLHIDTNDEIEQLALQFNKMAEAIRNREILLENHQKRLEETVHQRTFELQNERDKLQAIMDNVPSAFILIDENDKIISASAAIQSITNLNPKEVVGKFCYQVFLQDQICELCPQNQTRLQDSWQPRIRTLKIPEGRTIYVEHMTIPFSMKLHQNVTLEILTDVTERKKLETHLVKMEKLIATGEMSAVIAHELRNSLTSVKMILQLQLEKSKAGPERQTLNVAVESILGMEEVLNNMLRFSKPSPFEFQKVDINRMIEESLIFVAPQISMKKIEVCKDFSDLLPKINLDVNHIKEAFFNLLLNSVQSIRTEGKITVSTRLKNLSEPMEDFAFSDRTSLMAENFQYKIILEKSREVLQVEIEDNGAGIHKQNQEKIFDPFFTTKLSGTGLGLAITKRIINQHGGIILVSSKIKRGTKITMIFPTQDSL